MYRIQSIITAIRNQLLRWHCLALPVAPDLCQPHTTPHERQHAPHAPVSHQPVISEYSSDGVVVCDQQGLILLLNQAARTLLQLKPEQPAPACFQNLPMTRLAFGTMSTPDLYQIGGQIVCVSVSSFQNDQGATLGQVYVLRDLTDTVAIDQARKSFIATISHELRTPLMVLSGNTDLLIRGSIGPLTHEQQALMQSMRSHTERMTTLVNNVITLAELEVGTLPIELKPLLLAPLVDRVIWPVQRSLATRNIGLVLDLAPELPLVLADQHQLAIVIQQLLDNAQRYTQHGQVTIRTSFDQRHVQLDVIDTGCGIAPDVAATLFTRFSRGMERISSADRGFGLGLAIARELIERQGGQIWLTETSAYGSIFSVSIPRAHRSEELAPLWSMVASV